MLSAKIGRSHLFTDRLVSPFRQRSITRHWYKTRNMTFTLYALLSEASPPMTVETLETQLSTFFRNDSALRIQRERLPFSRADSLALWWGNWLVRIAYEEGAQVEEESFEISKRVGNAAPFDLSGIYRRVRVVFGADDARETTNEIIYVIDFLKEVPGVAIFDLLQNDFLE